MFKKKDVAPELRDAGPGEAPAPKPKASFAKRYRTFCYRVLGSRFERGGGSELLAERLLRAGMDITPGMYDSVTYMTTALGVTGAFVLSLVLFHFVLKVPDWYAYVALITGVTLATVLVAFRFLISSRIANRKDQLDRELPFTLSELSVLASTGMSPIQLVRRMARRDHDMAMTLEFKRVIYRTDVEGKDLITALAETAKGSPSPSVPRVVLGPREHDPPGRKPG